MPSDRSRHLSNGANWSRETRRDFSRERIPRLRIRHEGAGLQGVNRSPRESYREFGPGRTIEHARAERRSSPDSIVQTVRTVLLDRTLPARHRAPDPSPRDRDRIEPVDTPRCGWQLGRRLGQITGSRQRQEHRSLSNDSERLEVRRGSTPPKRHCEIKRRTTAVDPNRRRRSGVLFVPVPWPEIRRNDSAS